MAYCATHHADEGLNAVDDVENTHSVQHNMQRVVQMLVQKRWMTWRSCLHFPGRRHAGDGAAGATAAVLSAVGSWWFDWVYEMGVGTAGGVIGCKGWVNVQLAV
jgi:hypothetical protein